MKKAKQLEVVKESFQLTYCRRLMLSAGWEISHLDLDLTADSATVDVKIVRRDGRWLWARIDGTGRCIMETFQRRSGLEMSASKKGGRIWSWPQVEDMFLGRSRYEGPRSLMRGLTTYLTDNAMRRIELTDVRAAWAEVMASPARLHDAASQLGLER